MRMTSGLYGNMHTNLHKDGFEFVENEHIGHLQGKTFYCVKWKDKDGNCISSTQEFHSSGLCIVCDCHPKGSTAHAY